MPLASGSRSKRHGSIQSRIDLRAREDPQSELIIYVPPEEDEWYAIGADVAEGATGQEAKRHDCSAFHVMKGSTNEQVAVWHGRATPKAFARQIANAGYFYNTALAGVEWTGPGASTCQTLDEDIRYPRLYYHRALHKAGAKTRTDHSGFLTSSVTKRLILDNLANHLYDRTIFLHHEPTISELREFEHNFLKSGASAYSAPAGKRDDLVMALAIVEVVLADARPARKPDDGVAFIEEMQSIGVVRRKIDLTEDDENEMLNWCHR